ncbi:MAG: hypothetical protein ACE37F_10365 [Nannocystaceae bacterium]|nr:hypothetical protein [bacterium]
MDRVTRAKLDSLVHLLASSGGRGLGSVQDVARRFQLDPLLVQRVAEEQGVSLEGRGFAPPADSPDGTEAPVDPNQSTQVMSIAELHRES